MEQKLNLMKRLRKKKVGLALGSGGAKGLSHIGVIKFLEEMGIKIDFIAGSSIGALIGGVYATGISIKKIENIALKTDLVSTAKFFTPGFPKYGLVTGSKVQKFLTSLLGEKEIENLNISFAAVATDIITGREIIFNKGNLVEAIRASISIPIIFQPIIYNNIVLVDGGLVNPVPTNITREMGAEFIIAVNVMSSNNKPNITIDKEMDENTGSGRSPEIVSILQRKLQDLIIDHKWIRNFIKHKEKQDLPGIKKIFNQSIKIAQEKIIKQSIELYKPDVLIEPDVGSVNMFEFYKAEEIIEIGYKAAEEVLKEKNSPTSSR
ncbi:MAG: patatin-like phospholipase family protein [Candidatus Cloacimonetes bacterium]|nr:patatin-like phospholipase family protein [Candidatus Cloacimonadota bacterium]